MLWRFWLWRSISFYLLIATAALFWAQTNPVGPSIALALFGGPFLTGVLAEIALLVLFVEAMVRHVPRVLAAIPVLAFGAYYIEYARERLMIPAIAEDLQSQNANQHVPFDPGKDILAVRGGGLQEALSYRLPSAYMLNYSLSLASAVRFAVLPPDQCDSTLKKIDAGHVIYPVAQLPLALSPPAKVSRLRICVDRLEGPPAASPILVAAGSQEILTNHGVTVMIRRTTASRDGTQLAEVTTATAQVLPALPLPLLGCFLVDQPSAWKCAGGLAPAFVELDTLPAAAKGQEPVEYLLGLQRRTDDELAALAMPPGPAATLPQR